MKKTDVLVELRVHISEGGIRTKGQKPFADFFHHWLNQLSIPYGENHDFYEIDQHLPQLAVDAWEAMRTGTDETAILFRNMYEQETGGEMVELLELGERILHQSSGHWIIENVLVAITNHDWIKAKIENYCRAQTSALQGMFDKFIRLVYRRGLFDIITESRDRGMRGVFGPTELRTYVMAGRIMFTFVRPKKKGVELSVSFVGDDQDPLGLSAGIQSVQANLPAAFHMIDDVVNRWPEKTSDRKRIFKGDEKIAPDIVHAMRAQAKAKAKG